MEDYDFVQSNIDKCIIYREWCIIQAVIILENLQRFWWCHCSFHSGDENCVMTDKSSIDNYLRVLNIDINEFSLVLSWSFLIHCIIFFLHCLEKNKAYTKVTYVDKYLPCCDFHHNPCKHWWFNNDAFSILSYLVKRHQAQDKGCHPSMPTILNRSFVLSWACHSFYWLIWIQETTSWHDLLTRYFEGLGNLCQCLVYW